MHSILTGTAKIAKVCIWAERSLKGELETAEGRKTFSGKADFLVGCPAGPTIPTDSKFIFLFYYFLALMLV